jgi:hypothetical protein
VFDSEIYEYVNVEQEPRLRYAVLAGLFNVPTCPNCGRKAAVLTPFIYSDPAHNLLIYVHPRSDAPEEARQLILEQLHSVYVNLQSHADKQEETEEDEQNDEEGLDELDEPDELDEFEGGDEEDAEQQDELTDEELEQLVDSTNAAGEQQVANVLNDLPPLQIVFGLDQLYALINGVLEPEERLGKLALSTQSRNSAERGQFLHIARKLATEMDCLYDVEDLEDEYTVWLYGSRRRIGALMRELTTRG